MERIEVSHAETDVAIIMLRGEHDLADCGELGQTLQLLVQSADRVIVDLSEVRYIDSSVLNNLLAADRGARARCRRLTLQLTPDSFVAHVAKISGVTRYLQHAESRAEAVKVARNGGSPPG
jgi:anti-anti-sigma factor